MTTRRTSPKRDWYTPITLSGKSPVLSINNPVLKSLLCKRRKPRNLLSFCKHFFSGNFKEPLLAHTKKEGRLATPTYRITVVNMTRKDNRMLTFKKRNNLLVGIFNKEAIKHSCKRGKYAFFINWRWVWKIVSTTKFIVTLSVTWGKVHKTRSILNTNKVFKNIFCFKTFLSCGL